MPAKTWLTNEDARNLLTSLKRLERENKHLQVRLERILRKAAEIDRKCAHVPQIADCLSSTLPPKDLLAPLAMAYE